MPDATHPSGDVAAEDRRHIVEFPAGRDSSPVPQNNLPLQLTSFVGREREVAEVEKRLTTETRLLTLTGPGGSGKTRLGLAVSSRLTEIFEDGVWWVELVPISDPELVAQEVARVLMIKEQSGRSMTETLARDLAPTELLLVLDNCEHLVDACARLTNVLLHACPKVRILATSREALAVEGEMAWPVPTLTFPEPDDLSAGELEAFESVRLFVERASYRLPDFALDERNAYPVAEICRRLDGIPLAIELAAANIGTLTAAQISDRLGRSPGLLTSRNRNAPERQRTLKAALDWSYELLDASEKELFGRLSVFAGGFTLEAAEAVGSGGGIGRAEVLDLLESLTDKSLVVFERGEGTRYRLLEPVRQYASEKLEESGEANAALQGHARYYLALSEEAEPNLMGPDQEAWLGCLEREHDNLRAALGRTLGGTDEEHLGLRLAAALWSFWYTHGHLGEGRRWIERAVSRHGPAPLKAKALGGAGYIALFQGDYDAAKGFLEQSLALYRELGDKEGIASSLVYLGFVAVLGERDLETVPVLYEEAASLGPELQDPRVVANLTLFSGLIALSQGEMERSTALHEEALKLFRRIGDVQGMGHCLNNLALGTFVRADYDQASAFIRENLLMAQKSDYKLIILYSFLGLGLVAARQGQPLRAARLLGRVGMMEETFGLRITPLARSYTNYERHLAEARSQLDEAAWDAAWSEGRTMAQEEAVEYALQPEAAREEDDLPSETSYPANLSAREVEVLKLVAGGLTNSQVAGELFISPNTVNRHLNSIYRKLGVGSRAAAARFAAEHNLV